MTGVHSSSSSTRVRISRVLPWPRSPEQHDVVTREQRTFQLWDDRVVEADDPRERVDAGPQADQQVVADLLLDGPVDVPGGAQCAEGRQQVGGRRGDSRWVQRSHNERTTSRPDVRPRGCWMGHVARGGKVRCGDGLAVGADVVRAAELAVHRGAAPAG